MSLLQQKKNFYWAVLSNGDWHNLGSFPHWANTAVTDQIVMHGTEFHAVQQSGQVVRVQRCLWDVAARKYESCTLIWS